VAQTLALGSVRDMFDWHAGNRSEVSDYLVYMPVCLTVFADASFDQRSGIAAFAGWFRKAGSVHKISKVSDRRFRSSNEAELMALGATVLVALRHQRTFSNGDFVVAKSDCTYAVEHLKILNGGTTEAERRIVGRVHETLKAHGLKFYVRHVKGHSTLTEPRFYVNRWCDEEARRLMREAVKQDGLQQILKKQRKI
jgi:ribonuclease HI